jgi:hypothetical protein
MAAHFEHPLGNVRVWMVFGVSDACLRGFDNLGRYFGQFEQNGFDGANAPFQFIFAYRYPCLCWNCSSTHLGSAK